MTPKEMAEKRVALTAQAQAIVEKAKTETRSMTSIEEEQFDKIFAEVDELKGKIDATEKSELRSKRLDDEKRWSEQSAGRRTAAADPTPATASSNKADEYRNAYGAFLAGGTRALQNDEYRALQADSQTVGGFLTAPQQMVNELIKFKDNLVFMRGLARQFSVGVAGSLGAPTLETDTAAPTWTGEIITPSEDSSTAFGKRELFPHPLTKLIKVSQKLLGGATMSAEQIVRERLGYQQAITEENAFLNGTGASQPLGVFTASAQGISTGRDVSTDNTTTAITADGLINAKFSLKSQYQNSTSLRWVFHRTAVRNIRKLKDSQNQYLWNAGLGGTPDRILEVPYVMSEYAPSTFTTGLYVGIIGDFSQYWIADALNLSIQRLDELYAATNQVGFIARSATDGMPVLEEAFARVTLG